MSSSSEFSYRVREESLKRFQEEDFDILVIGGGITGAAVARDAVGRGYRVALVEQNDFASGTSSKSSKLIHGGLRYLENYEFGLVAEALSERTFLLKTAPHLVRPLEFYMPVFKKDRNGMGILSLGMWLYDLLALFRSPGFHKRLNKKRLKDRIPGLKSDELKGGFQYYDASMWDDLLAVETVRSASHEGAAIANYVSAEKPIWKEDRIAGFEVKDQKTGQELKINAKATIVAVGPWLDVLGPKLKNRPHDLPWKNWLMPSKGVHLVLDWEKLPVPGAVVMSNESDGRIVFVIPRKDFGKGVVIVGTTDGPVGMDPATADVEKSDVLYLLELLQRYFPEWKVSVSDILSAYVGVRPLMRAQPVTMGSEGQSSQSLQKLSREHHIEQGPGGVVMVAGGKYTTHRTMAEEIVEYTLKSNPQLVKRKQSRLVKQPVNPRAVTQDIESFVGSISTKVNKVELSKLFDLYGAETLEILDMAMEVQRSPDGFPLLESQFRFAMKHYMVLHLEDFYFRRVPLFMSRRDHGLPWMDRLSRIWANELGKSEDERKAEMDRLERLIQKEDSWRPGSKNQSTSTSPEVSH